MPQPNQYIISPLAEYRPIDFSNIGRMNAMDKQNSMTMAAEERALIQAQNDQVYNQYNAEQLEKKQYALTQERAKSERERVEKERAQKATAINSKIADIMKLPTDKRNQAWAGLFNEHQDAEASVNFLVKDLNENSKKNLLSVAMKVDNAFTNGNDDEAIKFLGQEVAHQKNGGNQTDYQLFEQAYELAKKKTPEAKRAVSSILAALSPELQTYKSAALQAKQDEQKLINTQREGDKLLAEAVKLQNSNKGILPEESKPAVVSELAKRYMSQSGEEFKKVSGHYQDAQRADPKTGMGAVTKILSYFKVKDAGSTVTQNEFDSLKKSGGLDENVKNAINYYMENGQLSDDLNKSLQNEIDNQYAVRKKQDQKVRGTIGKYSAKLGIPEEDWLTNFEAEPLPPETPTPTAPFVPFKVIRKN